MPSKKSNNISYDDRAPYERRKKESIKAFSAFCLYRDMGDERSIRKVAQQLGCSATNIQKWSTAHEWQERLAAWFDHLDDIARKEKEKERQKMERRHAEHAVHMGNMLMLPVHALAKRMKDDPEAIEKLEDLEVKDLYKYVVSSAGVYPGVAKLERLSRGESTDKVHNQHTGQLNIRKVEVEIVDPEWDAEDKADEGISPERAGETSDSTAQGRDAFE